MLSVLNRIRRIPFIFFNFNGYNARTFAAIVNIINAFFIRGVSILISFVLVPLSINYLGKVHYGVWITMGSIISWFSYFDVGLGNGLRNKFAIAKAEGQYELAKKYVSTTYAILSIIVGILMLIFLVVNPFLDWSKLLNAGNDVKLKGQLQTLSYVVLLSFCLTFVLKLISTILTADQKPAKASVFDLYSRLIALAFLYFFAGFQKGSIVVLGSIMTGSQVLVLLAATFILFNGAYKRYKPSFANIDFKLSKDLLNIGVKFFLIQIAALLLYQTNVVIISQILGPETVARYNIGFSFFGSLSMVFSIVISPFWSAFTEAWVKKDIQWINKIMKKLMTFWLGIVILGLLMVIFSKTVFKVWIGGTITLTYVECTLIFVYFIFNAWNGIFSTLLNGISIVNLQLWIGMLAAVVNVPLAIYLGKHYGLEGIVLANIIVFLPGLVLYPIQYYKIINGKSKGIWSK